MHTFGAGNRKLVLQLNLRRWPTKLNLKTKALRTAAAGLLRHWRRRQGHDRVDRAVRLADPIGGGIGDPLP